MKIGERIKMLRIEKGLSQEALGKMIGVSIKTVLRYEKGSSCPRTVELDKLAMALDVTLEDLMNSERFISGNVQNIKDINGNNNSINMNTGRNGDDIDKFEINRTVDLSIKTLKAIKSSTGDELEAVRAILERSIEIIDEKLNDNHLS